MTARLPKFCPACGQHHALYLKDGHPHCEACGATHWENDRPVAVMMLSVVRPEAGNDHGWFLITHSGFESDFAFPAGYVEMGESAEEAAVRELREETGVTYEGPTKVFCTMSTGRGQLLIFVEAMQPVPYKTIVEQFHPTPEALGWTAHKPMGWRHPLHGEVAARIAP